MIHENNMNLLDKVICKSLKTKDRVI